MERADIGSDSLRRAPVISRLFASEHGASDRLLPRWIFLRALGLIYFSAFYCLLFQIRGLIGPHGILPARDYLQVIAQSEGALRFWYAPSLLWISSASTVASVVASIMPVALCWVGIIASLLLVLNVWPRAMLMTSFVCFLSFVAAADAFSGYQSDGMILEAGFIAMFFAPPGLSPGLGGANPPSRFSLFLLQWEWFCIYFGSGIVKLASGDPQWRNFTAMDEYYQNGPLPTWIGWYVQHLPHWFHATTVGATLLMELGLVWAILLPRRFRVLLFVFVTCWQAAVILTANYAFLNYLVLALGILLVDDRLLLHCVPQSWKSLVAAPRPSNIPVSNVSASSASEAEPSAPTEQEPTPRPSSPFPHPYQSLKLAISAVMLAWIFYATAAKLVWLLAPSAPLPVIPVTMLEPFRIADRYGLFAVMTRGRYEIEFQGSQDGKTWIAYPFRYKPQALSEAPRIYAPYQPRFDWNLWFASLETWRDNAIVLNTEVRLLSNDRDVLSLFAGNPFAQAAPKQVRAVLWQYWFTTIGEKRTTGNWWRREFRGLYAPALEVQPNGKIGVLAMPEEESPRQ